VIDDALVGATAVLAVLRFTGGPRPIRECEPVRDELVTSGVSAGWVETGGVTDLVNRAAAPIAGGRCKRRHKKECESSEGLEGTHGWGEKKWNESGERNRLSFEQCQRAAEGGPVDRWAVSCTLSIKLLAWIHVPMVFTNA